MAMIRVERGGKISVIFEAFLAAMDHVLVRVEPQLLYDKTLQENYNGCRMAVLTMLLDPSLLAHVKHRADRAARSATRANMLAKWR